MSIVKFLKITKRSRKTYGSVEKLVSARLLSSFVFLLLSISASHFSSFSFKSAASYKHTNRHKMR
jgi:hypothetical protein